MRVTIDQVGGLFAPANELASVADRGHRRYRCWASDFDTRAVMLATKVEDHWEDAVKAQWNENKLRIVEGLRRQFGDAAHEQKVKNFTDMGSKPFSILTYHNMLFEQARHSFVVGAYYPALTGCCALGERILNHLVLDLREEYRSTPDYKRVHKKKSLDDWQLAIRTLDAWGVLLPDVVEEFHKLERLRHRSLHFDPQTYPRLRDDALAAVIHIREIVNGQFSTFGKQPWFIEGTLGTFFIKREYESNPFIRHYFLPQSPFVGIRNSIEFDRGGGVRFLDFPDYGDGDLTDEEYRDAFNKRDPNSLAKSAPETQ